MYTCLIDANVTFPLLGSHYEQYISIIPAFVDAPRGVHTFVGPRRRHIFSIRCLQLRHTTSG